MGSQVFKTIPNYLEVFSLLDEVCVKTEKLFVVTDITFKQLFYGDRIEKFYDYLRPYYHVSKRFYLEIERGYSGFLAVLRQLCKVFDISYVSKVVHHHGIYSNTLIIYIKRDNWENWETEPKESVTTVIKPSRLGKTKV